MTAFAYQNVPAATAAHQQMLAALSRRDLSLWSDDPEVQQRVLNRLGWLDALSFARQHLPEMTRFAESVRSDGIKQVVLLGMGGSSLAPEVFARCFDPAPGFPALHVLDSTCPDAVRAVSDRCPVAQSLYLVSSKSGTTAETHAFFQHFHSAAQNQLGAQAGTHFAAITDPGSPLETLAREREFRGLFQNPADVGGRFSALTYFGLVPAALLGIDLNRLLQEADAAMTAVGHEHDPALSLAIAIGELSQQGRNKLTLSLSPRLAPLGAWIEQLVAESTGKATRGVVPIDGESLLAPEDYGDDRVFVAVGIAGDTPPAVGENQSALAQAGQPVLHWQLADQYQLGGEFLRWEIATALAGAMLGINPFDEPDVNESKARTRSLLEAGGQAAGAGDQQQESAIGERLQQFCAQAAAGDYFALLAYAPPEGAMLDKLQALRTALGNYCGVPSCLAFGPRYLHSSGQLHKGGPNQGLFLVVTTEPEQDLEVPEAGYSFQELVLAQARGDQEVLKDRQRRVLHLHLSNPLADIELMLAALQ